MWNRVYYTDFGGNDVANSMALQSDGKIVVIGSSINTTTNNSSFALARYNIDGTLDASFGNMGKRLTSLSNDDFAYAVAIRSDDKIIVGGTSFNGFVNRFALAQFTANGNLDVGNFNGGNGYEVETFGNTLNKINSVIIKPDGKIIAAGATSDLTTYNFVVAQYTPAGILDASNFGSGTGYAITDFGNNRDDQAYAVALTSTGKILVGGFTDISANNNDLALAQYTAAGVLDVGNFGTGGKVITDVGASEIGYSLALQSDTKIILFGSRNSGLGMTDNNFVIARYLSNGALDPTFGGSSTGTNIIDFGSDDRGYSVALGPNYIMTSGISGLGNSLALARLTNNVVVLPVTFSLFTATKQNTSVLLNWNTQQEQDVVAFEVQKSSDGNHFNSIGVVPSSGNNQITHQYSLIDGQPFHSVNFYRLKVIQANGTYHYSGIVVVRWENRSALQAFPNPVHDVLYLQVSASGVRRGNDIVISDVTGRLIKRIPVRSTGLSLSTSIDMSALQNGIYFINIQGDTIKIIKY